MGCTCSSAASVVPEGIHNQVILINERPIYFGPAKIKPSENQMKVNVHVMNEFGEIIEINSADDGMQQLYTASEMESENEKRWIQEIIPAFVKGINCTDAKEYIFCLPSSLRRYIWLSVTGAFELMRTHQGYYEQFLIDIKVLPRQIAVDIPRTHQEHVYFRNEREGQVRLGRVLYVIQKRYPQVGYVQGMNMIVSLFLTVVDTEEEAFWLFVAYLERYAMLQYYEDGLTQLSKAMIDFGKKLEFSDVVLFKYLQELGVQTFCYVTPWFLTLFSYNTSLSVSARIFDVFFLLLPGDRFVYRFGLAYMLQKKSVLLAADFNESVFLLKELVIDATSVIQLCDAALQFTNEGEEGYNIMPQSWNSLDNFYEKKLK